MSFFIGKKPVPWLKRAARVTWQVPIGLQRAALVVGCVYTSTLIVVEVICRYFLHLSILWVEELTLYVVFWFFLMGAALVTHDRTHIKGGAVHMILRNRPKILDSFRLGTALLSLGLSCLFVFWAYGTFLYTHGVGRTSVHLYLPMEYAQLSMVPGFALMAVYFLAEAIDLARGLVRRPS